MSGSIQLHADLSINPSREVEALHYFETVYRPTARRFEGFVDLKLLKLEAALVGSAPAGINYRFSITFRNEALRRKWKASDSHRKVWRTLETFLTKHDYNFLLFEVV
jgi:hypothetical protein